MTLWSDVFWFASTVSLGLVAYAGLKAYRRLGDRFYIILAIAFAISALHSAISRTLFQQFQLDFGAPSGLERIAQVLRFEYLSSGEMILVLIGLLLHVLQRREPRSAVSGVPPVKDGI